MTGSLMFKWRLLSFSPVPVQEVPMHQRHLYPVVLFLLSCLCIAPAALAQEWTWMSGHDHIDEYASYGTQGTAAPGNVPGGRAAGAVWTDSLGGLWLFGGKGFTETDYGQLSDLWRFNQASGLWTWVHGSRTIDEIGVYGTRGVPAAGNHPGARENAGAWADSSGNLWLFGGYGLPSYPSVGWLSDLWMFNTRTKLWTWIDGPDSVDVPGVYGLPGKPAPGNRPGGRSELTVWADSIGNACLFGGLGVDVAGSQGSMNDLWRFDAVTHLWTWLAGSDLADMPGSYGTPGLPAPGNTPGARRQAAGWRDTSNVIWLFGGAGSLLTPPTNGRYSDLWRFEPATNLWTWMAGPQTIDNRGSYGIAGVPKTSNLPGGRKLPMTWLDMYGNLCLFGGSGFGAAGAAGKLSDMWRFDRAAGAWVWMQGPQAPNATAVFGTLGVPTISNMPGARDDAQWWLDRGGRVWIFGGSGYDASANGKLSDLWRLTGAHLPVELRSFSGARDGAGVTLQWTTESEIQCLGFRIERGADAAGPWTALGTVEGGGTTRMQHRYTFIDDTPPASTVVWYRLWQTDFDGSSRCLGALELRDAGLPAMADLAAPAPNPAGEHIDLRWTQSAEGSVTLALTDLLGRRVRVFVDAAVLPAGAHMHSADVGDLPPGGYLLTLHTGGRSSARRIVLRH
jgi:hypothetical protein